MLELTKTQRTPEWYKARLGMFTASAISKLMGNTDLKKNQFGDTAKGYIYKLGAERVALEEWDEKSEEQIDEYIRVTGISSKEIQWGVDYEDAARMAFELETGKSVKTTGSCIREERPYLSASPDGMIEEENAIIEIKCPQFEKFARYTMEIKDGPTLKAVCPDYYWQIQTQLWVTECNKCFFAWFHPWLGLKWAEIEANYEDMEILLNRIDQAEQICKETYNAIKGKNETL